MENLFTNGFHLIAEVVQDSVKAVIDSVTTSAQETVSASTTDVAYASAESLTDVLLTANNIWMMLATALVFIMHLGFAGVEAGFGQSKNTVNILFKNTLTPVIGIITYAIAGFHLMYPGVRNRGRKRNARFCRVLDIY
jgi:Amt family ammonium transporter